MLTQKPYRLADSWRIKICEVFQESSLPMLMGACFPLQNSREAPDLSCGPTWGVRFGFRMIQQYGGNGFPGGKRLALLGQYQEAVCSYHGEQTA